MKDIGSNLIKEGRFKTAYNPHTPFKEKNDGSSITQLDPGPSIAEMVKRYVLSGEMPTGHEVYYEDDEESAIEPGTDISDVFNAQAAAENEVNQLKEINEKAKKAVRIKKDAKKDEDAPVTKKATDGQRGQHDDKERGTNDAKE